MRKQPAPSANGGRITARPTSGMNNTHLTPGLHALERGGERDALLYIPQGLPAKVPIPLVVMLHGAGGDAGHGIDVLRQRADETPFLLLASSSRGISPYVSVTDRISRF